MAMLHYEAEIRPPTSVAGSIKKPKGIAQQLKLAQTLITQWSQENFDFSSYQDTYREKVEELIESKKKGRVISPPREEKPAKVLNLMEALKKSIATRANPSPKQKKRAIQHSA